MKPARVTARAQAAGVRPEPECPTCGKAKADAVRGTAHAVTVWGPHNNRVLLAHVCFDTMNSALSKQQQTTTNESTSFT